VSQPDLAGLALRAPTKVTLNIDESQRQLHGQSSNLYEARPGVVDERDDAASARVALKRIGKAHKKSDCCAGNKNGNTTIAVRIRGQYVAADIVAEGGISKGRTTTTERQGA